jgi:hypothetical protein
MAEYEVPMAKDRKRLNKTSAVFHPIYWVLCVVSDKHRLLKLDDDDGETDLADAFEGMVVGSP